MKITTLLLMLPALAFSAGAAADAFKCKAPDGSVVISATPCHSGSRTEAVAPTEVISPEQKRQAEREQEHREKALAEAQASRAAEAQRDQESQRRLAEENYRRQSLCLQTAQNEPDPQLRANLTAACTGTTPAQPSSSTSTQTNYPPAAPYLASPYYGTPYYTVPYGGMTGRLVSPNANCLNGNCRKDGNSNAQQNKPSAQTQSGASSCRQVGNSVRCY